ncbi:hypothetical protein CC78DRAFT_490904 [Lojkania enalia]|uniref:Uncharacterized protein n=1 Tax=Lojkania enalia TaxID=147567 RepID=A0A9P4KD45_9PLEO|nr:hypothetical protein CC78DRAFT_490904 [Didymosphaeria enalia]
MGSAAIPILVAASCPCPYVWMAVRAFAGRQMTGFNVPISGSLGGYKLKGNLYFCSQAIYFYVQDFCSSRPCFGKCVAPARTQIETGIRHPCLLYMHVLT